MNGSESCDLSRKMLGFMRQMSEQTGGLLTIDVSYDIGSVVIAPDGRHLGTIRAPEVVANVGWGDDGRSLYITAETGVYRVKLTAAGY